MGNNNEDFLGAVFKSGESTVLVYYTPDGEICDVGDTISVMGDHPEIPIEVDDVAIVSYVEQDDTISINPLAFYRVTQPWIPSCLAHIKLFRRCAIPKKANALRRVLEELYVIYKEDTASSDVGEG